MNAKRGDWLDQKYRKGCAANAYGQKKPESLRHEPENDDAAYGGFSVEGAFQRFSRHGKYQCGNGFGNVPAVYGILGGRARKRLAAIYLR